MDVKVRSVVRKGLGLRRSNIVLIYVDNLFLVGQFPFWLRFSGADLASPPNVEWEQDNGLP